VLAHPDDPAINLRWANTQVAERRFEGRRGDLGTNPPDRPEQPTVRLFYAVVLYRLDSLAEAGEQFHALDKVPMDAAARQENRRLSAADRGEAEANGFTAVGALGFQYDTNQIWRRPASPR